MDKNRPEFSVVVPVYNSEKTLDELIKRINRVFIQLNYTYEILLIDDYSYDDSWNVLKNLRKEYKNLKLFRLIHNFGQHNATLCGFTHASGNYIITLDDDLQHPPEEIPKLINRINDGYYVVYGKYEPKNSDYFEDILSRIFQNFMHRILEIPKSIFLSSFGIYKRSVVKNMIVIKSSFPFIYGLMIKSTPKSKIGNVDVIHDKRSKGKSNYGIKKYFKYSLNLFINYSSWPLLWVSCVGIIFSILSFFFGLWIILQKIIDPTYGIMGWNSLMVAICFIGGVLLMSMGIIGEYLRRILIETSHGQQYVIGEMEL
jgi:glycosyltransferase involved in cell wall biosynthesis